MHSNQRGGIVSFIIVAVALAGLLGGALYFSKQQGREARDTTPTPQISQRDESKEETTKDEQPAGGIPQNNQAQGTGSAQTPTTPSTRTPATGTDRVATTGPSQDLPATGPAETTAVVAGLSALTFAGYMLVSSRRGLRHSALRK